MDNKDKTILLGGLTFLGLIGRTAAALSGDRSTEISEPEATPVPLPSSPTCIPCSIHYLVATEGALGEASRLANQGKDIASPDIQTRIQGALTEIDRWERFDLSPGSIMGLPPGEREIVQETLQKTKELRDYIDQKGLSLYEGTKEDLLKAAAYAQEINQEFREGIARARGLQA